MDKILENLLDHINRWWQNKWVTADIKFIKLCKVEKIRTAFAKVNLSIKSGSRKLKLCIARLVMESEIHSKHLEKKKLKELESRHSTTKW